jgi:hypothetical protein
VVGFLLFELSGRSEMVGWRTGGMVWDGKASTVRYGSTKPSVP